MIKNAGQTLIIPKTKYNIPFQPSTKLLPNLPKNPTGAEVVS